jgi:hypothetical protein
MRAVTRQTLDNGSPNAATSAGDEYTFVFQAHE